MSTGAAPILMPMPDALKSGAKSCLDANKYNLFVAVAKDLKAGKKTRDDANGLMRALLNGRPDLAALFEQWSAGSPNAPATAPPAAGVGSAPMIANRGSAGAAFSIASSGPGVGSASLGSGFGGTSQAPASGLAMTARTAALGAGFGSATNGRGSANGGPLAAPVSSSVMSTGTGFGGASTGAAIGGASSVAGFGTTSGSGSRETGAGEGAGQTGPAFMGSRPASIQVPPAAGFGSVTALRKEPQPGSTAAVAAPSGLPLPSSGVGGGTVVVDLESSGGLFDAGRHGPLGQEELADLTKRLANLTPPGVRADDGSKDHQEEWLRWLRGVEYGPHGIWRVRHVLDAAGQLRQTCWTDMEKDNETRLAAAQSDIRGHTERLEALIERSKRVMVRERVLSKAAAQTNFLCTLLSNLAKPVLGPKKAISDREAGGGRGGGLIRPRDESIEACHAALEQIQEAAKTTFDAKILEWLQGGGGNGYVALHGEVLPRVPLEIHEEQLAQIVAAVRLPVEWLKEGQTLYSDDTGEHGARFVAGLQGPPDLKGQPFFHLPHLDAPPRLVFHVQRACFVYVLWDTRLKSVPAWLQDKKRFGRKEGMFVQVERGAEDAKEAYPLAVYKSTTELQGCVILGTMSSSRHAAASGGGGLEGCLVVAAYRDHAGSSAPHSTQGDSDEPLSDAQMLLRLWFSDDQEEPDGVGCEGNVVSNSYGHFRRRGRSGQFPKLEHFLPRFITSKKATVRDPTGMASGVGAVPFGSNGTVGSATGPDADSAWHLLVRGQDWDLAVSAILRRFVAVASIIDEFEHLNRAECSLQAVPTTCVRVECEALRRKFEAALRAIVEQRQTRLGSIFTRVQEFEDCGQRLEGLFPHAKPTSVPGSSRLPGGPVSSDMPTLQHEPSLSPMSLATPGPLRRQPSFTPMSIASAAPSPAPPTPTVADIFLGGRPSATPAPPTPSFALGSNGSAKPERRGREGGAGLGTDDAFAAAASYTGSRDGFVFKTGDKGLGYYKDYPPPPPPPEMVKAGKLVCAKLLEEKLAAAGLNAAAGSGGRKGNAAEDAAGLGPMPDALKRGVKEFLGDGTPKWKQFASVARELKAGAKTREDANNMMGIVLQGRPDLVTLFTLWSAPAGANVSMATVVSTITPGQQDGACVALGSTVTVHVVGSLKGSGRQFWSTRDLERPFSYQAGLGKVIKGWDRGMLGATTGEVRRLDIPAAEAYADKGFADWDIPPGADLIFQIEVLAVA